MKWQLVNWIFNVSYETWILQIEVGDIIVVRRVNDTRDAAFYTVMPGGPTPTQPNIPLMFKTFLLYISYYVNR